MKRLVLVKLAAPVFAAVGISVAAVAAGSTPGDGSAWVDDPAPQAILSPGGHTAHGHATAAGAAPDNLVLLVDGVEQARDRAPRRTGTLAYSTLSWTATPGGHDLVVAAGGHRSPAHHVIVVEPSELDGIASIPSWSAPPLAGASGALPPPTAPTAPAGPTSTGPVRPSPPSSTSPTPTNGPPPSPIPPTIAPPTTPPATAPPNTPPPATAPPTLPPAVARPDIQRVSVSPRDLMTGPCHPHLAQVQVTADQTTGVSVALTRPDGSDLVLPLTSADGHTWITTVEASDLLVAGATKTTALVTVTATNPTATSTADGGIVTIHAGIACPH